MRNFTRILAALSATSAMALSTAAISAELVVWHAYRGAEKSAFEKVVSMYNQSGAADKVKTLAVPFDAYADKITAAVPLPMSPMILRPQRRLPVTLIITSFRRPPTNPPIAPPNKGMLA